MCHSEEVADHKEKCGGHLRLLTGLKVIERFGLPLEGGTEGPRQLIERAPVLSIRVRSRD
jgi:hypothetical protein